MKISILLEALRAPVFQRQPFLEEFGGMDDFVVCYHVTEAKNAESILAKGLKVTECQQGHVTRQAACYLFVDKSDINDDIIKILGIENPVVIKARLTGDQLLNKAGYDGMFNGSFEDYAWSAIQYIDDISPEIIEVVK